MAKKLKNFAKAADTKADDGKATRKAGRSAAMYGMAAKAEMKEGEDPKPSRRSALYSKSKG